MTRTCAYHRHVWKCFVLTREEEQRQQKAWCSGIAGTTGTVKVMPRTEWQFSVSIPEMTSKGSSSPPRASHTLHIVVEDSVPLPVLSFSSSPSFYPTIFYTQRLSIVSQHMCCSHCLSVFDRQDRRKSVASTVPPRNFSGPYAHVDQGGLRGT